MARSKKMSFRAFSAEVLRLYQAPARRPATFFKMRQVLGELEQHCRSVKHLSPPVISDWLASHPERSAATHRSLLSALRAACSYGDYREYFRSPFRFRKLSLWLPSDEVDQVDPYPRHRSTAEIRRVLRRADKEARRGSWEARRLRAVVYTLAYTGADKTAVLGLRRGDIDLERGLIHIKSHARRRLKTAARARKLPIAAPLLAVLADWLPRSGCEWVFPHSRRTGPWLHGPAGKKPLDQVKQLGQRAGVEGLLIVSFRHTFATVVGAWTGQIVMMRLLGHSRPSTQKYYLHEDLDQLAQAVAKLRF
jgi:integrase